MLHRYERIRVLLSLFLAICLCACDRALADAVSLPSRVSPSGAFHAEEIHTRAGNYVLMHEGERCTASRVLVLFPGLGEARRGESFAIWGFWNDYRLDVTLDRLRDVELAVHDVRTWSEASRAARIETQLRAHPFADLAILSVAIPAPPYRVTPFAAVRARVHLFLAEVRNHCPNYDGAPAHTHIDGISLGGWFALEGAAASNRFAYVGATQAAIRGREVALTTALRANRTIRHLRILTSDRDPYRPMLMRFSESLHALHRGHEFDVVEGPHSYEFNRGAGGMEILLWHHLR